jgi:hypothetical protein
MIRKMPSLTVRELIAEASLGLRPIAGEAGQTHSSGARTAADSGSPEPIL